MGSICPVYDNELVGKPIGDHLDQRLRENELETSGQEQLFTIQTLHSNHNGTCVICLCCFGDQGSNILARLDFQRNRFASQMLALENYVAVNG